MNGIEAAASLFGSPESASDPFASLGTDTTSQSTNEDQYGHDPPSTVSNLPESSSGGSHSFGTGEDSSEAAQYHTWAEPQPNDYHAPSSQELAAGDSVYGQLQGWYDEKGQWHDYERQASESTFTAQEQPVFQDQPIPSNPYDPYVPSSNFSPPSSYTQTPYDSYSASAQLNNNGYIPPTVSASSPSQPVYNIYPSSGVSHLNAPYPPTNQSPYTSNATTAASVPPPPAPVSTVTRPKVSNAYDPPFPTTLSTRRGASARSTLGQQTYAAYQTYATDSRPSNVGGPSTLHPDHQPFQFTSALSPEPPVAHGHSEPDVTRDPTHNFSVSNTYALSGSHGDSKGQQFKAEFSSQSTPYAGDFSPHSRLPRQPLFNAAPTDEGYGPHQPFRHSSEPLLGPIEASRHAGGDGGLSEELLVENGFDPSDSVHTNDYSLHSQADSLNPEMPSLNPWVSYQQHSAATPPEMPIPPDGSSYFRSDSPQKIDSVGGPSQSGSTWPPISQESSASTEFTEDYEQNNVQTWNNYSSSVINVTERTSSPASIHASRGPRTSPVTHGGIINNYAPSSLINEDRDSFQPPPKDSQSTTFDPYTPTSNHIANGDGVERVASPGSFSVRSLNNASRTSQHTLSKGASVRPDHYRHQAMSNGRASASPDDPYMPSQQPKNQQPSDIAENGSYSSRYNYSNVGENVPSGSVPVQAYDLYSGQEVSIKQPQAPYAPSPSLLGANDPLGRTAARVPVFSFGFGGKLVTCFHGADSLNTGFDVALASRNSTGIHIRVLNKIIPASALDTSTACYPGPLVSDPGTPTTGLVRAGASTQTKVKKARVSKYLAERADEISRGIGYLSADSLDKRQAEGKLALVRLLNVMVENDGRLSGNAQIDAAVRVALLPQLNASGTVLSADSSNVTSAISFPPADIHSQVSDLSTVPYPGLPRTLAESTETPISVSTLRPSALEKIQTFLLRGERRQAYHYALDERLWSHAMIIASSIDKEAWKEVVNEFLRSELGVKDDVSRGPPQLRSAETPLPVVNGREGLRVAYSLFSGQGATAIQELVPQNLLSRPTGRFQVPGPAHVTPITPNFALSPSQQIPAESLSRWAEIAAMMFSSPLTQETSAALTALGDQLLSNQWIEAAHCCYLLAPQTSPMGGLGNPSARIVLLGSRSPQVWPNFSKDPDPIVFTEIAEFALSLAPPVKGQEGFNGLPHLQAYRLVRALSLAEVGDIQVANRYCEAISTSLGRGSPYITRILVEQLKGLSDRIAGVSPIDKSASWMGGKLSKPSLDTIGGWLEGRFTKLVTGDPDSATQPEEASSRTEERAFIGPFSHYSTISSVTSSASPSPQPSINNVNLLPPYRSESAMEISSPNVPVQIDRASSAMDYVRRKPSPVPRMASAGAATIVQPLSFSQAIDSHYPPGNNVSLNQDTMTPRLSADVNEEGAAVQEPSWWGSSSYSESSSSRTPTTATFMRVNGTEVPSSSEGFISLMDDPAFSVAPKSVTNGGLQQSSRPDDDEDLGFGNTKRPNNGEAEVNKHSNQPESTQVADAQPPDPKPVPTNSWLSRWWKRSESTTPGPIKASLGEETSFYYDKDLKRWINKKAASDESTKPSIPPPPPSRAQTASPGRTGARLPNRTTAGPPPARSASAIDLSTSPPTKTAIRVRSNLIPPTETNSAPQTPSGSKLAPPAPPPGRPRSQASKRNVRSRYVDVLHSEGST